MTPRDILPGMNYGQAIVRAIAGSRILVLIFSARSSTSPQVLREVERATSKGVEILTFRIDDIPVPDAMEYFISSSHWLDAYEPPVQPYLTRLAQVVASLLSMQEKAEPVPAGGQRDGVPNGSTNQTDSSPGTVEDVPQDKSAPLDAAVTPFKAIISESPCSQADLADLVLTAEDLAHNTARIPLQFVLNGKGVAEIWLNISRNLTEPVCYFRFNHLELSVDPARRRLPVLLRVYRGDDTAVHEWLTATPRPENRVYKIYSKGKVILGESVGYVTDSGSYTEVIPANAKLPQIKNHHIHTSRDNQSSLRIRVATRSASGVRELGKIKIRGIPRAPAGIPFAECKFRVDEDGRLLVMARDPVSKSDGLVIIG
jgi:hypothetical protein